MYNENHQISNGEFEQLQAKLKLQSFSNINSIEKLVNSRLNLANTKRLKLEHREKVINYVSKTKYVLHLYYNEANNLYVPVTIHSFGSHHPHFLVLESIHKITNKYYGTDINYTSKGRKSLPPNVIPVVFNVDTSKKFEATENPYTNFLNYIIIDVNRQLVTTSLKNDLSLEFLLYLSKLETHHILVQEAALILQDKKTQLIQSFLELLINFGYKQTATDIKYLLEGSSCQLPVSELDKVFPVAKTSFKPSILPELLKNNSQLY
ncbi:MAG: hypothetical protein ATN36_06450 [Epulopiscium sp. Nele67-Bin005]|nr:MAG: hypothetical protein ATN36_06450 [Epulopiscium sp. Nele67-Bin005]